MPQSDETFFRQFTLRICGSLEIERSLWECLVYIRNFFPADELVLTVYDPSMGAVVVVATADQDGGVVHNHRIALAPEVRASIERASGMPRVRTLENAEADSIIRPLALAMGWPPSGVMVNRLMIRGHYIGALTVRSEGAVYSPENARLWGLINEPAAIALANSQRHREILELKERLSDDNRYLQKELRRIAGDEIVGADFGLREVMDRVRHVAPLSSPVLLQGETGTGKEVIANAIHNLSPRSKEPFIKVNCGAIPETLIDSELFGHERGAFTGAISRKRGRFERAHNGTIFLDEIGELPIQAQVRLLRVLQEKEIERVGGTESIRVNIRVISGTHRDLEDMVLRGEFREDLYYRLKVFPISIPTLRDRKADIPVLVQYLMKRKSQEMGLNWIPRLAPGAMDRLMGYDWPGNVRELENAVERALILSDGKPLDFSEVTPVDSEAVRRTGLPFNPQVLYLDSVVARHIRRVVESVEGRIEGSGGAADLLGVNPSTLRHKMRKLRIPFGRKNPRKD